MSYADSDSKERISKAWSGLVLWMHTLCIVISESSLAVCAKDGASELSNRSELDQREYDPLSASRI